MATKNIYLSPSNQEMNFGVSGYGTEEANMHDIAHAVNELLALSPMFNTRISLEEMTLEEVANDSNAWGADLHICLHTDANQPDDQGTTAFISGTGGRAEKFAEILYRRIAELSPGRDRGVQLRPGLYELKYTAAPAVLIELFFHTSAEEVQHYQQNKSEYVKEIALAIYEFYDVPFPQPKEVISSSQEENIMYNPNISADEIINKCTISPEKWNKGKEALKKAVAADGDMGDIEVFLYIDDLIKKAYNCDR